MRRSSRHTARASRPRARRRSASGPSPARKGSKPMLHKTGMSFARADRARRGAISKGCLIAGAVGGALLAVLLIVGGMIVSKYNSLTSGQQNVQARWSEIDNQYKRR